MPDNANDLAGKSVQTQLQALADGGYGWEYVARYNVIDDEDVWGIGVVARVEVAPFRERNLHRLEIPGHDHMTRRIGVFIWQWSPSQHLQVVAVDISSQRELPDGASGLDLGKRPNPLEKLAVEGSFLSRRIAGKGNLHGQEMVRFKPRVHLL